MSVAPVPFFVPHEQQSDISGFTLYNKAQIDGVFHVGYNAEGQQTLIWGRRPGLSTFCTLTEPVGVDGLYAWTTQSLLIATCNGKTFKIDSSGTVTEITGSGSMVRGNRPTYATLSAGDKLYQASGGKIAEFSTTTGSYLIDADAPTQTTHIVTLNQVLVALRANSTRFDWSEAGAPQVWNGNYANAEGQADLAVGLYTANDEIYIPGQSSIEVWYDNGSSYERESRGVIQHGVIAPKSWAIYKGICFWLDNNREVMMMQGRVPTTISQPINKVLQSYTSIEDATGDAVKVDGKNFYILSFPMEGKTWIYDIDLRRWAEWSSYNAEAAQHTAFLGNCYASMFNKTFVGDRRTGIIYTLSSDNIDDAGGMIRSVLRTDFITRENPNVNKFCKKLTFHFKRTATATTPNQISLRYRNDGSAQFSNERSLKIEQQSSTDLIVSTKEPLGMYKMRQWQLTITDPSIATLVGAWEEFDYGN